MLTRFTTFVFTMLPTAQEEASLRSHVGASRFGYNQCLRLTINALEAKKTDATVHVPWTPFDQINVLNAWKVTPAAGVDAKGAPGLPWRREVCQQVFEEAAVDVGRALVAFSAGKRGERAGKRPGFPKMKKKATARASFRLRNKGEGQKSAIRFGEGESVRTIRLPKIGELEIRESTRPLRRMLKKGRAKILFATVSHDSDGRWRVALNVQAAGLHPARRHADDESAAPVGIDRGLHVFGVVADEGGRELERFESPRPLRREMKRLRRKSKALSRKVKGSRNRGRARERLGRTHARIRAIRHDFVHRESSRLVKSHGHLVIEDLSIAGMMKTRLARSVADSAWSMFGAKLAYKSAWYGAKLVVADRFYPSTRRCSACSHVGDKLDLSERIFRCTRCGHEADRDTNAAVNLAQYRPKDGTVSDPHVAAKHAETQNACGEESSGVHRPGGRETVLGEAGRASARRPRRAVST